VTSTTDPSLLSPQPPRPWPLAPSCTCLFKKEFQPEYQTKHTQFLFFGLWGDWSWHLCTGCVWHCHRNKRTVCLWNDTRTVMFLYLRIQYCVCRLVVGYSTPTGSVSHCAFSGLGCNSAPEPIENWFAFCHKPWLTVLLQWWHRGPVLRAKFIIHILAKHECQQSGPWCNCCKENFSASAVIPSTY
jgi:hypothetical protein